MADCLIGLGSNMGDRTAHLNRCVERICGHPQIQLRAVSRYQQTAPIGGPAGQGQFLNAALRIATPLSPASLLAWLQCVEQDLGRQRQQRWGPRVIDIDLLLYERLICENDSLTLPHPRMALRRFVLQPANDIAADMVHPLTLCPLSRLLARLDEPPWYIAVAGARDAARTNLVSAASARRAISVLSLCQFSSAQAAETDRPPHRTDQIADRALRRELDILARQKQLLTPLDTKRLTRPPWVVSDFWINQAMAVAATWPPGTDRWRLERACRVALAEVPAPKFVLLLDATPQQQTEDEEPRLGKQPRQSFTGLARALRQQVRRPGQVPILRVGDQDLDLALTELLAAIDAIQ